MPTNLLQQIKSPRDLKSLSLEDLQIVNDELREYIISTITEIGGHLASTLGVLELTTALHYIFDTPRDKIIWDVGHQAYAHKVLTGRYEQLKTIRQYEGLSGFLKISESEYDAFGAGHASTSISAALGIAVARDHYQKKYKVVSVIGDGAMTGGLSFEGLNNAGMRRKQFLVILNDNEMSISPNVGAINSYFNRLVTNPIYNRIRDEIWNLTGSLPLGKDITRKFIRKSEESLKNMLVPGILFEELGFRYFGPIDGHNLNEVVRTLKNISNLKTPALLHVLTKKGKGMVSMNVKDRKYHDDAVRFHAVKPNEKKPSKIEKVDSHSSAPIFQDVFGKLSCEIAKNRKDTVCITAAMKEGTGLVNYSKEFPDRFFDVGIAEAHAVTFAAGLATERIRPIVSIYSTFLQRAYDQIIHDVALQNLPIIFCMDRAGIVGEDGPTHHGALDIAYLKCVQDMIVTAPKDGNEFRHLLYTALEQNDRPFGIRYPKSSSIQFDESGQAELLPIGSWETLKTGKDIAILAVGSMVYPALMAASQLEQQDISCEVVNCRFIKPMDLQILTNLTMRFTSFLVIEEGVHIGGFGEGISSYFSGKSGDYNVHLLGLPDSFVEHGPRDILLNDLGLSENGIISVVKEIMEKFHISV
ncbi:MAG: 1-deoxy-D-xylulose-5-phosphate synthase [Candidatus Marinimicrobia bacterium]|jgi:1-deoxy-D-xylulose-5-phosphate synthase|nr:1-deoxy-D-xylulose-5-phosphate synthase [Candidatus Neomarinimicrobiota bacterium]